VRPTVSRSRDERASGEHGGYRGRSGVRSPSGWSASGPGGLDAADLATRAFRRSRGRLLVRKWRLRRAARNPMLYAAGFAVGMLLTAAVVGAGGAGSVYAVQFYQANGPAVLAAAKAGGQQSTRIYDRNGQLLYALQNANGFQFNVPYDHISSLVKTATVDTEDRSFWTNAGVNPLAIIRSAYGDLTHGNSAGGSTITQQLVKRLVLHNSEKQLSRKIQEAILSIGVTESGQFSKQQILEMYLNNIYYDDQNTGIEAAARNFFGYQQKLDANHNVIQEANEQLTLAQVAILVRIPEYPTFFYPLNFSCNKAPCPQSKWGNGNEQNVLDGATQVLDSMVAAGDLSQAEHDRTRQQVIDLLVNQRIYHWKGLSAGTTNSEVAIKKAPHFVDYVIQELISQFGMQDEQTLAQAGLSVYTTLDWNLDQFIEQDEDKYINHPFTRYWYCSAGVDLACDVPALKDSDNVHNAAAVALDPYSGDILAMVGSVDYASRDPQVLGFNNMATAARSMGSSFKPLVYATAMQMGWYPGVTLQDVPLCYPGQLPPPTDGSKPVPDTAAPACGGTYYTPHNYDENAFSGTAPLRVMLANSLNIPATEAQYFVGANPDTADRFLAMIGRMGVPTCAASVPASQCPKGSVSANRLGPTTALGTQEISLLNLTSAYSTFTAQGKHTPPRAILRIDNVEGQTLWTAPTPHPAQVLSPQVAYMMTSILSDNAARAGDFKTENPLWLDEYPDFVHYDAIAAKTGTSQGDVGPADIVTMGYSPFMTLGVWAGNTPAHDDLNQGIIGITGAGYIFHDAMVWAVKNYKWANLPFPIPPDLTRAQFNCTTGLAPYKGTDLNLFATGSALTPGSGWCQTVPAPGHSFAYLYAGYGGLYGIYRQNVDWIIQGQIPDVS
jgi:membrane peptidoglycan carboxypeptidase